MTGVNAAATVTVVIPCYNAERWVARAVESVLAQNHPGIDVIVVDDGSDDDSVGVLRRFGDRIRVVTGPNRGACHVRNRGLAQSAARYVLFLDADDYLEGEMLAGAVAVADAQTADLVLSNMHFDRPGGVREARDRYHGRVQPEALFAGWLQGDYVNPSAILWRADFVRRLGGWDETLHRNQDFDITLRAAVAQARIYKNETGRAIYTTGTAGSISQTKCWRATESRLRAHRSILKRIMGTAFAVYAPLLYRQIYLIARSAFQNGHADLVRAALDLLHRHGYRRHSGTLAHRLVAGLVGLERKMRLSSAVRSLPRPAG